MSDMDVHYMSLGSLKRMCESERILGSGDDFFMVEFECLQGGKIFLKYPCRLDGYIVIFCISGSFNLTVNMNEKEMEANCLCVLVPEDIVRISGLDREGNGPLKFFMLAVSRNYMSGLRFDIGRLHSRGTSFLNNPVLKLDDSARKIMLSYIWTASEIMSRQLQYRKDCVGSLITSSFFFAGSLLAEQSKSSVMTVSGGSVRASILFDRFIALVREYHMSERSVSFYAGKISMDPKYLSRVIKKATGRTASEWIDSYVVLEAKHMLKYSDLPVKEIVYRLNFPTQAMFCKYFKAHTGFTPKGYRNA